MSLRDAFVSAAKAAVDDHRSGEQGHPDDQHACPNGVDLGGHAALHLGEDQHRQGGRALVEPGVVGLFDGQAGCFPGHHPADEVGGMTEAESLQAGGRQA